jgi:hypothetical protein
MGSKIFDYLADSFLFDDSLIDQQFSDLNDEEILAELRRYRSFCLSAIQELEAEIGTSKSSLRLFSGIKRVSTDLLKQTAFYVEQHVLYDPLFELTCKSDPDASANDAFATAFGVPPAPRLERDELASVAKYLKALRPMIAANYVKLLPTSYFFEAPNELPFTVSKTGFAERVPKTLQEYFLNNAIVESVKNRNGEMIIDGSLELGRTISVRFRDHKDSSGMGFKLLKQEVHSVDRENRVVDLSFFEPPYPPERDEFDRWVYQSTNQAAGHLYHRIGLENLFAAKFNCSYLSDSPFVFKLLEQIVPIKEGIQSNTTNTLLNFDLPFLDRVDIETLMQVRNEEGEAFQRFRLELEKQLRDLRTVDDPEVLRIKIENVIHELSEVQLAQINRNLSHLRKKMLAEATVLVGSLAGAIQTSGFTIPIAVLAGVQGYKSVVEYRKQQRENPAFFLWKVLKD